MASEQLIRKTHDDHEGEVPQVTHFESLTVMDSGAQPAVVHRVVETTHGVTGGVHDQTKTQKHETQKSATATARDLNQQQQATKNQFGPISATSETGHVQRKKNNYGGIQAAATERGEQTKKQQSGKKETTGLTDVGKKGASFIREKAIETAEYACHAAGVSKDAALAAGFGSTEFATESTAIAATGFTDTVKDVSKKPAGSIGETAIAGKDITLDTVKATVGYVGKGLSVAQEGVKESMGSLNVGIARAVEDTAIAAESVTEKAMGLTDTVVDAGKDITSQIGKTTARSVGTAAGVVKNATLVGAKNTTAGIKDSLEALNAGVGGVLEDTTMVTEIAGQKATDVTLKTGKAVGGYANKATDVAKDATLVAGWSATEIASDAAASLMESMESLNAGVGGLVEGTALATESVVQTTFKTAVDAGKKGASYVGEKVVAGRDMTLETGKATTKYGGKAAGVVKDATLVGGWRAVEIASETAGGVTESMETFNEGVAGILEGTTLATEDVARKTFNTMVDVGKKGASYVGEKVVAGKDITLETGKATAEYVGKGASVVKDATLVGGWSALELASDTTKGVTESIENVDVGVAGIVENAAIVTERAAEKVTGLKDVAVDTGKRVASYIGEKGIVGKDTTVEYIGNVTDVVKDATLVAGWSAVELAGGTTGGITESIENVNAGVAVLLEGAALATEDVVQKPITTMADMGKKGANYIEGTAKNTALAAGRGVTEFASDTAIECKENLTTKPKNIVVERDEISIDYDQTRKTGKKEEGDYHQ